MKARGFTVIELVVVLGILTILLGIATLNFSDWQKKSLVERYAKELYTDLQDARSNAAYTKFRRGVQLSAKSVAFRRYSSDSDTAGTLLTTKQLPIALNWTTWVDPASNRIDFNIRGVMTDPTVKVICFQTPVDAAYDAIIITPVLTTLGKVTDRGNACGQNNVTQK
jgi:type IV fimbrial biogenesis protein FimT